MSEKTQNKTNEYHLIAQMLVNKKWINDVCYASWGFGFSFAGQKGISFNVVIHNGCIKVDELPDAKFVFKDNSLIGRRAACLDLVFEIGREYFSK